MPQVHSKPISCLVRARPSLFAKISPGRISPCMFKAVNTESEAQQKKIQIERQKIRELYLAALADLELDAFLQFKVENDQNGEFYKKAQANLLYNYAKAKALDDLDERLGFLECRDAFFEVAEKNIRARNFVRAKKLLNLARERGWFCNKLHDLQKRIEEEYFAGGRHKLGYKCGLPGNKG